jgi:hypothetical protein
VAAIADAVEAVVVVAAAAAAVRQVAVGAKEAVG